jgi:hypothetical protein
MKNVYQSLRYRSFVLHNIMYCLFSIYIDDNVMYFMLKLMSIYDV